MHLQFSSLSKSIEVIQKSDSCSRAQTKVGSFRSFWRPLWVIFVRDTSNGKCSHSSQLPCILKAPQRHGVNLHSKVESVYLIPLPPPSDHFAEDKTSFVPWFAIYGPMLVPKEHFFLIKCSIRQFILECSLETMPSLIFLLLGVIWTPTVFLCPINCPPWFQWLLLLCRWALTHVFSQ